MTTRTTGFVVFLMCVALCCGFAYWIFQASASHDNLERRVMMLRKAENREIAALNPVAPDRTLKIACLDGFENDRVEIEVDGKSIYAESLTSSRPVGLAKTFDATSDHERAMVRIVLPDRGLEDWITVEREYPMLLIFLERGLEFRFVKRPTTELVLE